jgi:hypothetical protein
MSSQPLQPLAELSEEAPYHAFPAEASSPCTRHVSSALAGILVLILTAVVHWDSSGDGGLLTSRSTVLEAPTRDIVCVFIHGAGGEDVRRWSSASSEPSPTPFATSYPEYWGRVHERLPQCSTFRFMRADTNSVGWEDAQLQERACSLLEVAAPAQLVIFAHSLGNLLLAAALDARRCALPPDAAWLAVAAPWAGSRAADALPGICAGAARVAGGLVRKLAQRERFCTGANGSAAAGYLSLATSNGRLRALAQRWQHRANGSLCGGSAFGLWSIDSWSMEALADLVRFGEPNDGAVPLLPCHLPGADVGSTPESATFTAAVNHIDTTCRHGDGSLPWSGDDRRPCAWYPARVSAAVRAWDALRTRQQTQART